MARRTALRNVLEYAPARLAASLMQCFPERRNLATCATAARAYAMLCPSRMERARTNIRLSFPDWDEDRVQRTAIASVVHLFQLAGVDGLTLGRAVRPTTWHKRLHLDQAGPALERLVSGGPVLLLTGHCGNWELLGYTLSVIGYPIHALARPLDNPLLNRWVMDIRQSWGLKVLTKWGATPQMQSIIESGGHLGFIADQNAGPKDVFVPFFGRLASAYKSIALLAMRYDIPVIVASAQRRGQRFEYDLVVGDVIDPTHWADQDDPLYYLTARYTRALEHLVKACPEQYLWLHRRWKTRPPHVIRRTGMPESLERRIRALPWLDDADADEIIDTSNREAR